jgi:hypothetical protein
MCVNCEDVKPVHPFKSANSQHGGSSVMPHQIAEPLRQLAIKFAHLANSCTDKCTANDLQEARVELVEKLDDPFKNIDATS